MGAEVRMLAVVTGHLAALLKEGGAVTLEIRQSPPYPDPDEAGTRFFESLFASPLEKRALGGGRHALRGADGRTEAELNDALLRLLICLCFCDCYFSLALGDHKPLFAIHDGFVQLDLPISS